MPKRSDKRYNKEVDAYKFFIIDTEKKQAVVGFEFKEDAHSEMKDNDYDVLVYKVVSEAQLSKLGIDNPKDKWKTKMENGGEIKKERYQVKGLAGYIFDSKEPNDSSNKEFDGVGIFDTFLGFFTNISNPKDHYPYRLDYETSMKICEWMNSGEIDQKAIYTIPHIEHKFQDNITLAPLEIRPLSTQLKKLTGDGWSVGYFINQDDKREAKATAGNIIEHKATGKTFAIPPRLYEYVDGMNVYINPYTNLIQTYPDKKIVALIDSENNLDTETHLKNDTLHYDRSALKKSFEKGFIPTITANKINIWIKRGEKQIAYQDSLNEEKTLKTDSNHNLFEKDGASYLTIPIKTKGFEYTVLFVWGKFNYVSIKKQTANPWKSMGTRFDSIDTAIDHYKNADMKAQLMIAEKEAKKHGYVAQLEKGGEVGSETADKISKLQAVVNSSMMPQAVKDKAQAEIHARDVVPQCRSMPVRGVE
jgi:hypothetical protein